MAVATALSEATTMRILAEVAAMEDIKEVVAMVAGALTRGAWGMVLDLANIGALAAKTGTPWFLAPDRPWGRTHLPTALIRIAAISFLTDQPHEL